MARLAPTSSFSKNLRIGTTFQIERTFTAQEVEAFLKLTGDTNNIHTSAEAARERGFRGAILPGWLVGSLIPAIIADNYPGAVYASQDIKFLKPELVGRKVTCVVKVASATRGAVTFSTAILGCDGQEIINGSCMASVPMGSRSSFGTRSSFGSQASGTLSPAISM